MSSEELRKNVGAFIVKALDNINKKDSSEKTKVRRELETQIGQIFVVDWVSVKKEVNVISEKFIGIPLTDDEFNVLKKRLDSIFKHLPKPKSQRRKNELEEFLVWLKTKNKSTLSYYIVNRYSNVKATKASGGAANKAISQAIALKASNPLDQVKLIDSITGAQKKGQKHSDLTGFQVGHGEFGGVASSGISVAKLREIGLKEFAEGSTERRSFLRIIHDYERNAKIDLSHRQVITSTGHLRKDYKVIISLQSAKSNQDDARKIERKAFDILKNRAIDFSLRKASTKLSDAITATSLANLMSGGRNVGMTVSGAIKPKKTIREKSKASLNKKVKFKTEKVISKVGTVAGKIARSKYKSKRNKRAPRTLESLLALKELINNKLPKQVEGNMGLPALVYRTGRFAQSVNIENISQAGRVPLISYTYMLNPYKVFETTPPWATPERNPRKLIEKSIREIALELTEQRFILRRV